jgi:hypothetical protein
MGAFVAVIPVVATIVGDIVKAIDAKKSSAAETAKSKAATNTKTIDDSAAKGKQRPGTVVKAAQDVAANAAEDTIAAAKEAAVTAGKEAAKVPNTQKSYSEAQQELSDQLHIVCAFLNICFQDEDDLIKMQAVLDASNREPLSPSDKRLLKACWDRISQDIGGLKRDQQTKVADLNYPSTQVTLSRLFDTRKVDPGSIGDQLKALLDQHDTTALDELNRSLAVLQTVIHEINELAFTIIKDVIRGLADTSSAGTKAAAAARI